MDLNIGVIGTGDIGADHVRRLSAHVAGARVQAVFDVDTARAAALAAEVGAVAHQNARDLIDDPGVDAVLIAAPSPVHTELTIECINARKQVFCEKPLAPSSEECLRVMEAETRGWCPVCPGRVHAPLRRRLSPRQASHRRRDPG